MALMLPPCRRSKRRFATQPEGYLASSWSVVNGSFNQRLSHSSFVAAVTAVSSSLSAEDLTVARRWVLCAAQLGLPGGMTMLLSCGAGRRLWGATLRPTTKPEAMAVTSSLEEGKPEASTISWKRRRAFEAVAGCTSSWIGLVGGLLGLKGLSSADLLFLQGAGPLVRRKKSEWLMGSGSCRAA